jgi:hypothetical protein
LELFAKYSIDIENILIERASQMQILKVMISYSFEFLGNFKDIGLNLNFIIEEPLTNTDEAKLELTPIIHEKISDESTRTFIRD